MPPNSTQNLNAKLSAPADSTAPHGGPKVSWKASSIHGSAPPVRIVGAASSYRGGYHLSV